MKRLLLCIAFLLFGICLAAQDRGMKPVQVTIEGANTTLYNQSHALVIGVSTYNAGLPPLPGVVTDVNIIKAALEANGFNVVTVMNPDNTGLQKAFSSFIAKYGREPDNRLLIYFAGHGYTDKMPYGNDIGYICPINTPDPNKNPSGFQEIAMPMRHIETFAYQIKSKHALFLFDACFSGSIFSTSRAIPEVISYKTKEPVRQFITSGSADETVPDKSIFRGQFIRALNGEADGNKDGFLTGTELGEFLLTTVVNYSYGSQHPQYGKIRNPNLDKGDFVFLLNYTTQSTLSKPTDDTKQQDAALWLPEMVYIKGGTYRMGCIEGYKNEKPVHTVTVNSFYLGKYEVTVAQFNQFIIESRYQTQADKDGESLIMTEHDPIKRKGVNWKNDSEGDIRPYSEFNYPVIHVSWNDAIEYCKWLSQKTGISFRLPTEAEWEYAAGNGSKHTNYSWGNGKPNDRNFENLADLSAKRKYGWEWALSDYNDGFESIAPVGSYNPNEFKLHDMTGNVYEWCSDWYDSTYYNESPPNNPQGPQSGTYKMVRGGSYICNFKLARTPSRMKSLPENYGPLSGFRIAHELQDEDTSSKLKNNGSSEKRCPGITTIIDPRDGQVYPTIQIGTQCWMQKNMNYQTGNSWCYDNKKSNCDTYGRLYNWETALTVCPNGWHLPSDEEWTTLTDFLGGKDIAGGKMKETGTLYWESPNKGATNSSGFTALPGGNRHENGGFVSLMLMDYFWLSSEYSFTNAYNVGLAYYSEGSGLTNNEKTSGFSCRCIKDY